MDRAVTLPYSHLRGLQEREHQLAKTERLAHVGGWTWDIASGTVEWSDELYRIFGLDPKVFAPTLTGFLATIEESHRSRCRALVEGVLADGEPLTYECPIVRPDGSARWIRSQCLLERAPTGAPLRMYGTAQDITDFGGVDTSLPTATPAGSNRAAQHVLPSAAESVGFAKRAGAVLAKAARHGWTTGLLFVETRGLARILAGDETVGGGAAEEITRRLLSAVRPYDAVVSWAESARNAGARERTFTILCEDVSPEIAAALGARVAGLFDRGLDVDGHEVPITVEVGIAIAAPGDTDLSSLRARAREAVDPRGVPSHPPDVEPLPLEAVAELRQAFDGGQLCLHYQPKVALDSDRVVAVEALLRWEHPDRGLIPPLAFIGLAERTGLIIPIGAWVIDEACAQASRWHARYPRRPAMAVSVNLSARQFGRDLVGVVERALVRNGTNPSWLCLEITESLLMDNMEEALEVLDQLSRLGVALSIDDFGTGFSSLSRLKRLPVDEIKIDKSFIDGLDIDPDDTAVVAAIISMAHAMRLGVVAEGVETDRQLDRLRTLGCDQVQGYLLARPGPAHTVEALVSAERCPDWRSHVDPSPTPAPAVSGYRPERILVIDDTVDVRALAVISLTAAGFEVHGAVDGASALSEARRLRPDCVVLDVLLPDINGLEVCRALRADAATADCTILMLSTVADRDGRAAAFSGGADDYIVKPFSPRDLVGRVRAAMRRRREDTAAEPTRSAPVDASG